MSIGCFCPPSISSQIQRFIGGLRRSGRLERSLDDSQANRLVPGIEHSQPHFMWQSLGLHLGLRLGVGSFVGLALPKNGFGPTMG